MDSPGSMAGTRMAVSGRHGTNAPSGADWRKATVSPDGALPRFSTATAMATRSGAVLAKWMSVRSTHRSGRASGNAADRNRVNDIAEPPGLVEANELRSGIATGHDTTAARPAVGVRPRRACRSERPAAILLALDR